MSALLIGSRREGRQTMPVGARDLHAEPGESADFGEQTLAPALGSGDTRLVGASRFAPSRELRLDGRRVDFPHQPPYELELTSARLSLSESLRFAYGFREVFGQRQGVEAGGAQAHQSFSQILEGVHCLLAPGLGERHRRVAGACPGLLLRRISGP